MRPWQKSSTEERKDRRSQNLWAARAAKEQQDRQLQLMMQMMTTMVPQPRFGAFSNGAGYDKGKGKGKGKGQQPTTAADLEETPPPAKVIYGPDAPVTGLCEMCGTKHHKQPPPRMCRSGCGHCVKPVAGHAKAKAPLPKAAGAGSPQDAKASDTAAPAEDVPPVKKPVVNIPERIAKAKAAAEAFVLNHNTPADSDLDMGDGTVFPSAEEIQLMAQMDLFGPEGAQPNAEVHALMAKQLEAMRAKHKAAKSALYDKKAHREVAKLVEAHRVWLVEQLEKEEMAILEAEAALARRREAYSRLKLEMDTWIQQAETAVTAAARLIDPQPMEEAATATIPAAVGTTHVAHEMGRNLEASRAERAARLAAHQAATGRPLSMEEIFAFTENACSLATVSALSTVQLTATAPITTAVPPDDFGDDTTMPANF